MSLLTITIPTATYNVGSATIPTSTVPAGATSMDVLFNVTNWTNPDSRLTIALEISLDNQATWVGGGSSMTHCGADGTFRGKNGEVLTSILASFSWPSGVTHLRGTLTITGASINTGGTVTVN